MKYWNKSKSFRQHWTKVQRPIVWSPAWNGVGVAYPEMQREDEMKRWCQQQKSKGKFYFSYGNATWYFSDPKDATWFLMNWS